MASGAPHTLEFFDPTEPALVLAPMDGVTDALMRDLFGGFSPFTFCVSEFVRVNDVPPSSKSFSRDIPELHTGSRTASGLPVHVQILGGSPEAMARAAEIAIASGARGIDINFGCPAPTVNRHDGGATLLKFPERIEAIVSAVRSVVPPQYPVSAKLRLGWDDPSAIHRNAEMAARGGAAWITIHGRTKVQGYTPPAYWDPIGVVRRNLDIPVIANGEIWNADDLARCQDATGCIHFMLGRGALAEPHLAAECAEFLRSSIDRRLGALCKERCGARASAWTKLIHELIERSIAAGEHERRTLSRIKQWLNYAHHKGAVTWFSELKRLESISELVSRLGEIAHLQQGGPNVIHAKVAAATPANSCVEALGA